MAGTVSADSPNLILPRPGLAISASDYISKITTVMTKSGVYGKDFKKVEPSSKRDEATRDPPIDRSTDSGGHRLDRGRSKSLLPPEM